MTVPPPALRRNELPHDHQRRWLVRTLVAVVVAVGLIVGGPWVYARVLAPEPAAPLALTTPTPTPTPTGPVALQTAAMEGSWTVGEGSQAGYRLGEVLSGEAVTVVGRTEKVTGSVVVAGGMLTSAEIVVDTASIVTDQAARDAYFRRALDTSSFPVATFTLSAPVDLAPVNGSAEPVVLQAPGVLTFHGISRDVVAAIQVQGTAAGIEVLGSIPVTLQEFELEAPTLGFVTVEPTGTVEMLLTLTR